MDTTNKFIIEHFGPSHREAMRTMSDLVYREVKDFKIYSEGIIRDLQGETDDADAIKETRDYADKEIEDMKYQGVQRIAGLAKSFGMDLDSCLELQRCGEEDLRLIKISRSK